MPRVMFVVRFVKPCLCFLTVAIAELRALQTTYMKLLEETRNLHSYFSNVIYTQVGENMIQPSWYFFFQKDLLTRFYDVQSILIFGCNLWLIILQFSHEQFIF